MTSPHRVFLVLPAAFSLFFIPWLVGAQAAATQPPPSAASESVDSINATKLFLEGRALLKQDQPQLACQKLEQSRKLAPTLGTLFNLGLCHHHSDRLATAHEYYRQAEVAATLVGDTQRREMAHNEAAELAPQRATLLLRLDESEDQALEIRLDDVAQPRDELDKPIFIDAGEHQVTVQAPGQISWHGAVSVVDGGKYVLVIPKLRPEPTQRQPPPSAAGVNGAPARAGQDTAQKPTRVLAYSLGGAGLAALGVSFAFAVVARNQFVDSRPECNATNVCTEHGIRLRRDALADAARASVLSVTGGVAVLTGIALWFVSQGTESESARPLSVTVGRGLVSANWRWTL